MRSGIIGKKIGNSSFFDEDGSIIPVTIVKVDDCVVSQIKIKKKDGYNAIQLASIENNLKLTNVKKPQRKILMCLKTDYFKIKLKWKQKKKTNLFFYPSDIPPVIGAM